MKLADTTLDFNHPALKSKVKKETTDFGIVSVRTLGFFCLRDEQYKSYEFSSWLKSLREHNIAHKDLTEEQVKKFFKDNPDDEKRISKTSSINIMLDIDNKEWFQDNKHEVDSTKLNEVQQHFYDRGIDFPVGENLDSFIFFNKVSMKFLSKEWKDANQEYLQIMENEIAHQDKLFFQALQDGDLNGVKKAKDRGVDLKQDNQKSLDIAIENNHTKIIEFLIKEKFQITNEHVEAAQDKKTQKLLSKSLPEEKNKSFFRRLFK